MINSWDKVTIGKYQEIKAIVETVKDENEARTQLLSCITDIEIEDLLDMPLVRYNHLLQNISFIYEEIPKTMVATKYVLGGVTFDVMLNMEKMITAQFIDYQNYIKDVNANLVPLLSIFLIPKGKKYNDGYDIVKMQQIIRDNLCIVDAAALTAFFLKWYESLLKVTVSYLTKKMKKMMKAEKDETVKEKMKEAIANLEKSGDGLALLTEYQKL
jgi:hypothetical protein